MSISLSHHLTDAVPNLHTRAPVGNPPLGPGDCRGRFYLRNSSGSLGSRSPAGVILI